MTKADKISIIYSSTLLLTDGGNVKKNFILTIMVVFAFMAMVNLAMAGPGCPGEKSKTAKAACAKVCASKAEGTSETTTATTTKWAECKKGEAHAGCEHKGKCEKLTLDISGMTCGGCESSVTKTLMNQDGVFKVVSIDHKSGKAVVCFDPTKTESVDLVKAVTKMGYKTVIVAALEEEETKTE